MRIHGDNRLAGILALIFAFLLGFPAPGHSQTADQYVELGKTDLASGSLAAAHANFQSALSLDSNHQGANFFYALTRVMMISQSPAFNTLLDRAGVSADGRDIFQWQADFERNAYGDILLPADSPTGTELQTFAREDVVPVIDGALGNLGKVGSGFQTEYPWTFESGEGIRSGLNTFYTYSGWWNTNEWVGYTLAVNGSEYSIVSNTEDTLTVSPNLNLSSGEYDYRILAPVEIDYGDVLVVRGGLHLAKAGLYIFSAYNVDADIDAVVSRFNVPGFSIQTHLVQAYPQLMTLLPAHQLTEAKASVGACIEQLAASIQFILGESDAQANDLITLDAGEAAEFSATLEQWSDALDGPTLIGDLKTTVDLTQFFDNPKNLRSFLPAFRGMLIKRGSYPDPTLGGILPAMTAAELNRLLAQVDALAPLDPTDFDGDGRSDLTVWRPGTRVWYTLRSGPAGGYTSTTWGMAGDVLVPGDYDGDGKSDIAVWRPGTGVWYIRPSATGGYTATSWGIASDVPVPGDYDGDGKDDRAVWRPGTGVWYVRPSASPSSYTSTKWGMTGDIPVPGKYFYYEQMAPAVWRAGTGIWYIFYSSYWYDTEKWGMSGDIPVPGDYDADGDINVAVWRPSTGVWYMRVRDGYKTTSWGTSGDIPVPGDYDGDGLTDPAVWRPGTGVWYIKLSGSPGSYAARLWGKPGDVPISTATGILDSMP